MSCGIAPVITDIAANQPWVKDNGNGFLIPTRDCKMLAAKITYLIRNGEIRKEFGKASRAIVMARAEHEKEMEKVEKLYRESIAKS
jgi:glycosyltransferase involved in cell wall biosynthesis